MPSLHQVSVGQSALVRRSTRREPWQLAFVRNIGPEDYALIQQAALQPTNGRAPLSRLREPHHHLAKLLASGTAVVDASRITGYCTSRIRTLENDPAFSELIVHYREVQAAAAPDIDQAITNSALIAGAILQERMEDDPESFSNKELLAIRDASLDRIGKGPTSKRSVEITNVSAVLSEVREMMAHESAMRIVSKTTPIETEYHEVADVESSPTEGPEER